MGVELIEREAELDRLHALLEAAAAGDGRVVLVGGEAGIGKTALLGAARGAAEAAGLDVLSARGGRLERDFAYGVARQLFEPALQRASGPHRQALLDRAAQLALPVLDPAATSHQPSQGVPSGDTAFATNHGLYWLTANLAERQPLLLLVDDAHWADPSTLLFLNYLGRRLEGLPVVLGVALRWSEPGAAQELLESLRDVPRVLSMQPSALSEDASGALVARLLGRPPGSNFRRACHEVTGGNPFLLVELVRALAAENMAPTDSAAGRVRQLAPESIARSVLGRLGAMSPGALSLARAVSVLDTDAELRHAASLAELDLLDAEGIADDLAATHILAPGRPLRFAHPIMRQAVYEDLPAGRRAGYHARAARRLDAEGGDSDRAAVHLLAAEPAGDPWVLDRLRGAARRALARGAPVGTVALLRRALAEPPPKEDWAATHFELGRAERLAGDPSSVEHLGVALRAATDSGLRSQAARELAAALAMGARLEAAAEVLESAISDAPDRETKLLVEADLFGLSQASDALAARVAGRLEEACRGLSGDTAGERLALAASVFHLTFGGVGSGEEVAEVARRAWGNGRLMKEQTGDHFAFYGPLIALRDSDRHDEARPMLEAAVADGRARGSAVAVAASLATLARLEQLQGNLVQAEAASRTALELAAASTQYHLMFHLAASTLVLALVERGRLDAADAVLAEHGVAGATPPPTTTANNFLAARAKLRLAQHRTDDALADTTTWLQRQRLRGRLNPVGASSILNPALPFLAAGDRQTAGTLAREMLDVAERWGVPGYIGSCQAVLGLVVGGAAGTDHLLSAVAHLERSPRRLELASALVELGAALRRANRRSESREPLSRGMELAHRCGAVPLAERATEELRATGARPRKLVVTGVEALTAQERRVAGMASVGMGNREIAQALFITRRTVETHLGHAYQKLGVGSREALRAELEVASPPGP